MRAETDALGRTVRRGFARPRTDGSWTAEHVDPVRPSLQMNWTATARHATAMRRQFAQWLAMDVAAGVEAEDLVLAVYEAIANVVDHAYADEPGLVRLVAHRTQVSVRVTVADDGRWRPGTGSPFRNHGLSVMRALVAQLHVDATGSGTTVHLCTPFPAPDPPAAQRSERR